MATYKVVPFMGKIKSRQSAAEVSGQLQSLINGEAGQGWELDQIQAVNIEVKPGCLAGLFGAKEVYIKFDQVIFRKP
jgi:hypothetical protein